MFRFSSCSSATPLPGTVVSLPHGGAGILALICGLSASAVRRSSASIPLNGAATTQYALAREIDMIVVSGMVSGKTIEILVPNAQGGS